MCASVQIILNGGYTSRGNSLFVFMRSDVYTDPGRLIPVNLLSETGARAR
jgi:hypothetical protein